MLYICFGRKEESYVWTYRNTRIVRVPGRNVYIRDVSGFAPYWMTSYIPFDDYQPHGWQEQAIFDMLDILPKDNHQRESWQIPPKHLAKTYIMMNNQKRK